MDGDDHKFQKPRALLVSLFTAISHVNNSHPKLAQAFFTEGRHAAQLPDKSLKPKLVLHYGLQSARSDVRRITDMQRLEQWTASEEILHASIRDAVVDCCIPPCTGASAHGSCQPLRASHHQSLRASAG